MEVEAEAAVVPLSSMISGVNLRIKLRKRRKKRKKKISSLLKNQRF
jgi:hypothetical protein